MFKIVIFFFLIFFQVGATLAEIIKNVVGYKGSIIYDKSKPDGVPQKLLDSTLINSLGWTPTVSLKKGIAKVYNNFKKNEFNS